MWILQIIFNLQDLQFVDGFIFAHKSTYLTLEKKLNTHMSFLENVHTKLLVSAWYIQNVQISFLSNSSKMWYHQHVRYRRIWSTSTPSSNLVYLEFKFYDKAAFIVFYLSFNLVWVSGVWGSGVRARPKGQLRPNPTDHPLSQLKLKEKTLNAVLSQVRWCVRS